MSTYDYDAAVRKQMAWCGRASGDPQRYKRLYEQMKRKEEEERRKQAEAQHIACRARLPFKGPALAIISMFNKHKAELHINEERLIFTDLEDPSYSFALSAVELRKVKISHKMFAGIFSPPDIDIVLPTGKKYRIRIPHITNESPYQSLEIYLAAINNAKKE
ncbi:MAG TPA: hypothetical protein PKM67_03870 [Kiritimatiellia bacterium]|nr:hypothetical protein [Kiritimatiellia bacterium]